MTQYKPIGTATVDIRYHGTVLLIDMEFMDTRSISPSNITDCTENGEIFDYASYQESMEIWRHLIYINNNWRLLEFESEEQS